MYLNKTNENFKYYLLNNNVSIKDLMFILRIEDTRTAIKWCKRNGILIFKFGKEKYVNKIDFELAFDQAFIESLKTKYPESWKEVYVAYKDKDYLSIIEQKQKIEIGVKTKFSAPGISGEVFLKKVNTKTK